MFVINRKFLLAQFFNTIIKYTSQFVRIRDIENIYFLLLKYTILELLINDIFDSNLICEKLQRQIYIINNLKINLLLNLDILDSQKMHLDYKYKRLIIDSCKEILILITIISVKNKINKIIKAFITITISFYNSTMLSMRLRNNTQLLLDCNFMFVSYQQISNCFDFKNKILFYIINVNLFIIQVNNTLNQFINIDKNSCLDTLQKYKKKLLYSDLKILLSCC